MEATTAFNLDAAIRWWLERLRKSSPVKADNLRELETHLRDSVDQLQSKGLTLEESFWIGVRRVGMPDQLGPEFSKTKRSIFSIFLHVLILLFFTLCCFCLWGLLHFPEGMSNVMIEQTRRGVMTVSSLPAFTNLVVTCGSFLYVPPLVAAIYCVFACFQKSLSRQSWVGFFAMTMATLALLGLATAVALFLPVLQYMQSLVVK